MIKCTGGGIEARGPRGKRVWCLRLHLLNDEETGSRRYPKKYIRTDLPAVRGTRTEAERRLAAEIAAYTDKEADMLLSDYCRQWMERKRETLETTTYESYLYRMQHITGYFDVHPVSVGDVKPAHVQAFYDSLLTKKKIAPAQRQDIGLGNRSIKDIAVLLRSVIDDAYLLDYITDARTADKIRRLKYPQRPEAKDKRPYLSPDSVRIFLAAIRGHRLEAAFTVGLFYGLRREEICGLRWSAIRDGRIYIEYTVARVKTTVAKDRTKTAGSCRDHILIPEIKAMLDELRRRQRKNRLRAGSGYQDSGYVFTWEDGRPYSPDYLTKSFKKIVRRTDGLDDRLHLHDLRASCVSALINGGLSPKAVQGWTGHDDAETMFSRYARADESEDEKLAEFLRNVMF